MRGIMELPSPTQPFQPMSATVASTIPPDVETIHKVAIASQLNEQFRCRFEPTIRDGRSLILQFDEQGNPSLEEMRRVDILKFIEQTSTTTNGEHSTLDMKRIHIRDIRKLEDAFSVSSEPSITFRSQAVLLNTDPVRAIILRNTCLVFVPDGADSLLHTLKQSFHAIFVREQSDPSVYELQALEAILVTITRHFAMELQSTLPALTFTLERLARGKYSEKELEALRGFKNTMHEREALLNGIRRMLMDILDSEEDLQSLYLSRYAQGMQPCSVECPIDSEVAEVVLENYLQDIYTFRSNIMLTQQRIQSTESLVMLKLDAMRNQLLGIDLIFSVIAMSLALGTFITGAFGMNLTSHYEEKEGWFWSVFGYTALLILLFASTGVYMFKRHGIFM